MNDNPWITIWIATAGISGAILGSALTIIYSSYKERKTTRRKNLEIHFNELTKQVLVKITSFAFNLTLKHNRLVFGDFAPVSEVYSFENEENYSSFEIHFPEMAKEWTQLNQRALKLNESIKDLTITKDFLEIIDKVNKTNNAEDYKELREKHEDRNIEFASSLTQLQSEFSNYGKRLSDKLDDIRKYQMGIKFQYIKKCSVCRKF